MTSEKSPPGGQCQLDFLIEPFAEGHPGPHVLRTLEKLRSAGLDVVLGPFGNTVVGDEETLISILPMIARSAYERGASRILLNLSKTGTRGSVNLGAGQQRTRSGQEVLGDTSAVDEPIAWNDALIEAALREDLHGAIDRIINAVETLMGGHLGGLPRGKKQAAVRIMDEQGVFLIRKSVETVAKAMGVSRITIYNYLNAIRGD